MIKRAICSMDNTSVGVALHVEWDNGNLRAAKTDNVHCNNNIIFKVRHNLCGSRYKLSIKVILLLRHAFRAIFLAATKQLYDWFSPSVCLSVCPSVCLSVRPSHLFHHVPIIVSSWNFQGLLPMTKVTSMQKVKVRGQRSRSQRSTPNLTVSGL